MDAVIAIRSSNFCLIAQDTFTNRSIIVNNPNYSKISQLSDTLFTNTGPQGGAFRLSTFVNESALNNSIAHNINITPTYISTMFQNNIYKSLREDPTENGAVVCGKENNKYKLYSIDQYGAMIEGDYFCVGYVSMFGYGTLDDMYKKDMSVQDAIEVVKKIGETLKKRIVINYSRFNIKYIDETGTHETTINI